MAENTKIQWTTHTMNPWLGCSKVAEGCENCYAETLMADRYHRVVWGPRGTRQRTKTWRDQVKWNREAEKANEVRKVFCASLADVFEDFLGVEVKDGTISGQRDQVCHQDALAPWRNELFGLIDRTPFLTWLLLTKRPENVRRMWRGQNRDNVWIGTSIANQKNADEYVPRLLSCRGLGPVLFLSIEPQIGRIDLSRYLFPSPVIDWVICGGESKQGHGEPRTFDMEWARLIVNQCREANVPCFVKQMGSNPEDSSRRIPLMLADGHGGDMAEWPEELRVRQCPETFVPSFCQSVEV